MKKKRECITLRRETTIPLDSSVPVDLLFFRFKKLIDHFRNIKY